METGERGQSKFYHDAIHIVVSCPNPGQVENAVKMGNFHLIDSVVNYECNECYVGGGSIKCGNNRQWTPAKPTCQGKYISMFVFSILIDIYRRILWSISMGWFHHYFEKSPNICFY